MAFKDYFVVLVHVRHVLDYKTTFWEIQTTPSAQQHKYLFEGEKRSEIQCFWAAAQKKKQQQTSSEEVIDL